MGCGTANSGPLASLPTEPSPQPGLLFILSQVSYSQDWLQIHHVAETGLEPLIFPPPLLSDWNHKVVSGSPSAKVEVCLTLADR